MGKVRALLPPPNPTWAPTPAPLAGRVPRLFEPYPSTEARAVKAMTNPAIVRGALLLWQDGTMIDLGALVGPGSVAAGINESGEIVGAACISAGQPCAVVWPH